MTARGTPAPAELFWPGRNLLHVQGSTRVVQPQTAGSSAEARGRVRVRVGICTRLQGAHGERRVLRDDEAEVERGPIEPVEVVGPRRVLGEQEAANNKAAQGITDRNEAGLASGLCLGVQSPHLQLVNEHEIACRNGGRR